MQNGLLNFYILKLRICIDGINNFFSFQIIHIVSNNHSFYAIWRQLEQVNNLIFFCRYLFMSPGQMLKNSPFLFMFPSATLNS